jgi:SSS family solute:Na+ symporter
LEQDLWDYMAVTGAVYFTGAFALLLFGLYWKRASTTGAYLALAAGFLAVLGLGPVRELLGVDRLGAGLGIEFRGEFVGLSAAALCLVLMVLGSLLFPGEQVKEQSEA